MSQRIFEGRILDLVGLSKAMVFIEVGNRLLEEGFDEDTAFELLEKLYNA